MTRTSNNIQVGDRVFGVDKSLEGLISVCIKIEPDVMGNTSNDDIYFELLGIPEKKFVLTRKQLHDKLTKGHHGKFVPSADEELAIRKNSLEAELALHGSLSTVRLHTRKKRGSKPRVLQSYK